MVLITSQKQVLNPEFILEVKPFSKNESIDLLKKITHEPSSPEMETLAQDLEGIPLLLGYAANHIRATPGYSIKHYQKTFSELFGHREGPLWAEMDINRRYFKSLAMSWQLSLASLKKDSPKALEWLYCCSYFCPDQIPVVWLSERLSVEEETSGRGKDEILKALQRYGIIRYDKTTCTISIHRFFQYLIREMRKDHTAQDIGQAIHVLSLHALDYSFYERASWRAGENWFVHAAEVERWLTQLNPIFQDRSNLLQLADVYIGFRRLCFFQQQFNRALEVNQKLLDLLKSIYDEEEYSVGAIYYAARLYTRLYRLPEGLEACQKAEKILKSREETQAAMYASILSTKSRILHEQGKYAEALENYEKTYQIYVNLYGEENVHVGRALYNRGRVLHRLSRLQEVLELCPKIEAIYEKTCGASHPFYAVTMELKGKALRDMGRYLEALELFQKALTIFAKTLGPQHRDLESSWDALGWCYFYMGDYMQSKQAFAKVLEGKSPGSLVVRGYRGLGWSFLKLGEVEKAFHYFEIWLQNSAKVYSHTPKMQAILEDFKQVLEQISYSHEKFSFQSRTPQMALVMSEEEFGKDHPLTQFFSAEVNLLAELLH